MSFDKLKSFWRGKTSSNNNQSLILKTSNFISNTWRSGDPPITQDTSEFYEFLASLPQRKKQKEKNKNNQRSLKPEKIQKILNNIQPKYLTKQFQIEKDFFKNKVSPMLEHQNLMQNQLDQIQYCLFNQVSTKFDEIVSVVTTISSLEFIVNDNQQKLKLVRSRNLYNLQKVTQKQRKIVRIQRKIQNLKQVKLIAQKLKQYKDITCTTQGIGDSLIYKKLQMIRNEKEDISKLIAGRKFDENIQNVEDTLKRSFSDKINEQLEAYLLQEYSYSPNFWKKFQNKTNIFQQKTVLQGTTAFLDQSIMVDQQIIVPVKKDQNQQKEILNTIKNGWRDSEYFNNKLKQIIKKFIISKYLVFVQDFRNLCDQVCSSNGVTIQNPNLPNLLSEMCPKFCAKAFNYFLDLFKSMLLRLLNFYLNFLQFNKKQQNTNQFSINEKQNMKNLREALLELLFCMCIVATTKLLQLIQMKYIHDAIDIGQFKQIIGIYENYEQFIHKIFLEKTNQLPLLKWFENQTIFEEKLSILEMKNKKQQKIQEYLNRMHQNIVGVQLKQKLEDETWESTDIPTYFYDSLHYLLTGQSLNLRRNRSHGTTFAKISQRSIMYETSVLMQSMYMDHRPKKEEPKLLGDFRIIRNDIFIKGKSFKVTETILLILQIIEDYMTLGQFFPIVKNDVGKKINQILRTYNSSSCQLIVHKGALALKKINSKAIKAKHLALSSVCLSFLLLILQLISQRIDIVDLEQLQNSYNEHITSIITILSNILDSKTKQQIKNINTEKTPSKGTESIVSNTKILYEILSQFYDAKNLKRVFTEKIFSCYLQAINSLKITSRVDAQSLKSDVEFFFEELQFLQDLIDNYNEYRIQAQKRIKQIFQTL